MWFPCVPGVWLIQGYLLHHLVLQVVLKRAAASSPEPTERKRTGLIATSKGGWWGGAFPIRDNRSASFRAFLPRGQIPMMPRQFKSGSFGYWKRLLPGASGTGQEGRWKEKNMQDAVCFRPPIASNPNHARWMQCLMSCRKPPCSLTEDLPCVVAEVHGWFHAPARLSILVCPLCSAD